jgi:2-keto-4-pentenoate hydratase/2-oxohepta-3-ene-1,7-dioic acid hydratase in catechol pathway
VKLVTYQHRGHTRIGAVQADRVIDLSAVAPDMLSLIDGGQDALARARAAVAAGAVSVALDEVRLLAPIPQPRRNVMCLGKNYAEHARESNEARGEKVEIPDVPVIFTKATTAVNGPYDDIPVDARVSEQMDYESELALIIGRPGRNIDAADGLDHVFGYTVLNDVTARDLQQRHKQFFKGKSLDGCCPIGPWIVTADEIPNPQTLRISCHVNGELRQDSTTAEMIFDVPATLAHLSNGMTLLPGDIIATGTPSGVGFAMKPPVYLRPGDVVECYVEKVGTIRNRVVAFSAGQA